MENKVMENCRAFSAYRNILLDEIIMKMPLYAEYSSTFHSIALFTTIASVVAIYAQIKALTLFSLHPTCMLIGDVKPRIFTRNSVCTSLYLGW
jgi:hypothetical protein